MTALARVRPALSPISLPPVSLQARRDLAEQVIQRPRRAAGELPDGAGDLGGVAVGPRAAVILVQADKRAGEPLVQPGTEQRLAHRVVGRVDVGDLASRRAGELGG